MNTMCLKICLVFIIGVTLTNQRTIRKSEESLEVENDNGSIRDASEITEEETDDKCQCNWRLLRHYEAKGCEPTDYDECGCPLKFDCPNINEIEGNDIGCQYKGKVYAPGAIINITNPCESCRCAKGPQVRVVCSTIECLNFNIPLEPGCHFLYEDNQCCPSRITCDQYGSPEDEAESEELGDMCEYEGNKYPLGARMYSNTDPCEVCICTKNWNESNNTSCYQQDCVLEKFKAKLMDGCVPVYNEQTCCPIEFYCAPDDLFTSENEKENIDMLNTDSVCVFGGKYYEIGKSLSINQDASCITCTCQVPPDFTCLHHSCPPNPNEENCQPYFTSDSCCPKYECLFSDSVLPSNGSEEFTERELEEESDIVESSNSENPCLEISCTDGRACMLYQVTCDNSTCPPVPTCLHTNESCPTPQCAEGCVVTEQDANRCPTCLCGDEIEKRAASLVRCTMPRCIGEDCYLAAGEDGCPACFCRLSCAVPECPPGCNVLSEIEGRCPKCVCEDETEGCPTPVCEHEGCRIENLPNGCPTCVCDRGRSGGSMGNSELEKEESQPVGQTINMQLPQEQQQQDLEHSGGSHFQNPPPSDDYDEITVMNRRSAQTEEKAKMEYAPEDEKSAELDAEDETQIKHISSNAKSLKVTTKKSRKREP